MARKKGTVTKAGKGKFSWFLQLDGEDFYYNTKFEPKCGEGDVVGIEYTPKGGNRGNISKTVILQDNSGGYAKANSEAKGGTGFSGGRGSSSSGGAGFSSKGGGQRQESIVLQHSQEMAVRAAEIILSQTAWAVKGKPDEKYTQIEALIDQLTVKFYNDAMDPAASKLLKEAEEIKQDAEGEDDWGESEDSGDDWGEEAKDGENWDDDWD